MAESVAKEEQIPKEEEVPKEDEEKKEEAKGEEKKEETKEMGEEEIQKFKEAIVELHSSFTIFGDSLDFSPFSTKVLNYLKYHKIPFKVVKAQPKDGPKKKIPFIKHNGMVRFSSRLTFHLRKNLTNC